MPDHDTTPPAAETSHTVHLPILEHLVQLQSDLLAFEASSQERIDALPESRRASARNLLHYVALRRHDIRSLQDHLATRGLSSLGRCEASVLATLNAVIEVLCRLTNSPRPVVPAEHAIDMKTARERLQHAAHELFGPQPRTLGTHIMVTMPSEAAENPAVIADLLAHGMDCMRVNCAHDGPTAWRKMVEHLRHACREQQRPCKVLMDLGGPKLRTGPVSNGPAVVKWKPQRDALGRVVRPACVWFHPADYADPPPEGITVAVPLDGFDSKRLAVGDQLRFRDARGRRRKIHIVEVAPHGILGHCERTAYVTSGMLLTHRAAESKQTQPWCQVAELSPRPQSLLLRCGDRLVLGDDQLLGTPEELDAQGNVISPGTIGCTLPTIFESLKPGDRVLFDDGKISTRVLQVGKTSAELEVTRAGLNGTRLRADKGINLPDTQLHWDPLTPQDLQDLDSVLELADIVGYSFVRLPEDVQRLQQELANRGRGDLPILLKIENRQAFERLPSLLLAALRSPAAGVMIARGDLAVEMGWQRLAEVQEEILWMCEAAHLPVVWATQVLESLAKTGVPSRAEITDAAMGVRAECVMLNKGEHILETVHVLSDILSRMRDHQIKKRPLLRKLRMADDLLSAADHV